MRRIQDNVYRYDTRKGERYMARVDHGYRSIRRKGFLTSQQAQDWVDLFRADLVNKKYFPERVEAPPLNELAEAWLMDCEHKNLRHNTLRSYRTNLTMHVLPILGTYPLNRITRTDIAEFIAQKKRERPEKPYSRDAIRLMLSPLSVLFSDLIDEGRYGIEANPCLRPGRLIKIQARQKPFKAYSAKEEAAILKACRTLKPDHEAALCTLFWAGLRHGELWALTPGDVDLRTRCIQVSKSFTDGELHDTPKTGQTRLVEIPAKLAPVLRGLSKKSPLLFPGRAGLHHDQSQWNRRVWTPIVTAAAVPRYPPYATRHTYATRQLERGCSLQWLMHQMGHSSITVTVDTYGHLARGKT